MYKDNVLYEKHKQKVKDRYYERKEKGLCARCGKNKPKEGKTKCDECTKKQRESDTRLLNKYVSKKICVVCKKNKVVDRKHKCKQCSQIGNRTYDERKVNGKCTACGKFKAVEGKTKCIECLRRQLDCQAELNRKLRELKDSGICIKCKKNKAIEGKHICDRCRIKSEPYHNRYKKQRQIKYNLRKEQKLCTRCGEVLARDGKTTCQECENKKRIINKKRSKQLIEQGICIGCGKKQAVKGIQKCEECVLKGLAHLYKISYKKLKRKLKQQNGRCYYSGKLLQPGVNLSVDHIKPRSRYPKLLYKESNLVLVDYDVNISKRDLEVDEFFAMVKNIYEYNFKNKIS